MKNVDQNWMKMDEEELPWWKQESNSRALNSRDSGLETSPVVLFPTRCNLYFFNKYFSRSYSFIVFGDGTLYSDSAHTSCNS